MMNPSAKFRFIVRDIAEHYTGIDAHEWYSLCDGVYAFPSIVAAYFYVGDVDKARRLAIAADIMPPPLPTETYEGTNGVITWCVSPDGSVAVKTNQEIESHSPTDIDVVKRFYDVLGLSRQ